MFHEVCERICQQDKNNINDKSFLAKIRKLLELESLHNFYFYIIIYLHKPKKANIANI